VSAREFGLVTLGDWLPDPRTRSRVSQRDRFRQIVDLGVLAEELGFASFHVGEHHFSDYAVSSPPVVLAAVAEKTTRLRLSTAATLLPHLDPVRVAEDYATVDVLSNGRVELVGGRGVYQDHYRHFHGSWDDSDAMLTESVNLLRRLWTSTDVTWQGRFRSPLDHITVQPRPVQVPHPPIALSASSKASVDRAVALQCPIVIPTVSTGRSLPAELAAHYRECWALAGHDPAVAGISLHVHLHVGDGSTDDARRFWAPFQQSYLSWVLSDVRGRTGELPPAFRVDDNPDAQAVCGSVDDVAAELRWRLDAIGPIDRLLVQCDQGGLPPDQVSAAVTRFARDVAPFISE
jgi:alkanesulfonate monooxygenase SsuD/methylene tetrahydromethanopterin reductase-like flavin-dependent oxidoreductase (luciferase family)